MGREWNDKLSRRLGDSSWKAVDNPRPVKLLVSDYDDRDGNKKAVVELLAESESQPGRFYVMAEYIVNVKRRPKILRYREETRRWPG